MADNQITPFQLTDQFTMDNFNQRINETNTALQNKAPAGYGGFGETLPYITAGNNDTDGSKFDALIEAKFATLPNNTTLQLRFDCYPAVSGNIFFGTLWKSSANYGVLTGWSYDGAIIRKVKTGGAWLPFEWVNPPLTIDKEYRTTERYLGKPVYAKAVSVGDIAANNLSIANTFSNGGEAVVRAYAIATYNGTSLKTPQHGDFASTTFTADGLVYGINNQIRVYIKANSNITDCVAVAYYTKA